MPTSTREFLEGVLIDMDHASFDLVPDSGSTRKEGGCDQNAVTVNVEDIVSQETSKVSAVARRAVEWMQESDE